ncbi:hypothetical protein sos41_25250 [Alphaproteobacteria bacterium SO-S41]|nr:hypothetical protein sos41_25250 [Alphaproteobacteria bacterium SO-S41]
MQRVVTAVVAGLLLVLPACSSEGAKPPPPVTWEKSSLVIDTASGPHRFDIELAVDDAERERGLMYRTEMAEDAGMLFFYPTEEEITMWMKNTVLPLDMVFIRSDGTVFDNVKGAVPYSLDFIRSGGPVRAVLELNAGTVDRIGLRRGDTVRHALFGNAAP